MEIIYRAKDGTEFYSEEECVKYESMWFISDCKATNLDGSIQYSTVDIVECCEKAVILEFKTDEAAKKFKEAAEKASYEDITQAINGAGIYMYCEDFDYFAKLKTKEEVIEIMKNLKLSCDYTVRRFLLNEVERYICEIV